MFDNVNNFRHTCSFCGGVYCDSDGCCGCEGENEWYQNELEQRRVKLNIKYQAIKPLDSTGWVDVRLSCRSGAVLTVYGYYNKIGITESTTDEIAEFIADALNKKFGYTPTKKDGE